MTSSYIIDRQPLKFGGQQQDYQKRIQALVTWGARQIKEATKEEQPLVQLFFRLFDHFSEQRQKIAIAHRNANAEEFGTRRDLKGANEFYHTILSHEYSEYNVKILAFLAPYLRQMSLEKNQDSRKSKKIEDVYHDRTSSLEIEILENKELINRKWIVALNSKDECPPLFVAISPLRERRIAGEKLDPDELQMMKQGIQQLKEKTPTLYKQHKMGSYLSTLSNEYPSPKVTRRPNGTFDINGEEKNLKSIFVLATARLTVNGKMFATTQYLTWLYRDHVSHPVDRMLESSTVMLLHQDNFLINDTLQEIAHIFANTVLASKDLFKARANLFRYYFAHNMPCDRGSSAISEIFEMALYEARDLSITYNPKKLVDLEALTSPLLSLYMDESQNFSKEDEFKKD
jgi:hypothetical protein